MQKEIIGDCTLYCGDAIEIMKNLYMSGVQADLLVSDPPYKLTYGGQHGSLGGCLSIENYDNKGGIVECDIEWSDFMPLFFNVIRHGHAYVMCNNRHVQNMLVEAEKAGFKFHNLLVWDKHSPTPNRWYMKNCEYIGFFYKGKAKFINNCGSKQLIRIPQIDESDHPTEKPVLLMRHYIENSSEKGDVVIDAFMGSGTTGIACIQSGRKFIGIEIDQKWFDIACERIAMEYDQPVQEALL